MALPAAAPATHAHALGLLLLLKRWSIAAYNLTRRELFFRNGLLLCRRCSWSVRGRCMEARRSKWFSRIQQQQQQLALAHQRFCRLGLPVSMWVTAHAANTIPLQQLQGFGCLRSQQRPWRSRYYAASPRHALSAMCSDCWGFRRHRTHQQQWLASSIALPGAAGDAWGEAPSAIAAAAAGGWGVMGCAAGMCPDEGEAAGQRKMHRMQLSASA